MGPWFVHLITFMVPTSVVFRLFPQQLSLLFSDYRKNDLRPSRVSYVLAWGGSLTE